MQSNEAAMGVTVDLPVYLQVKYYFRVAHGRKIIGIPVRQEKPWTDQD